MLGSSNKLTTFSGQVTRSDEYIFVSQSLIDQDKTVFFAVLYRAFSELICGNLQSFVGNREKNFTMVNVTSDSPDIWCNFLPGNSLPPDLLYLNATLAKFNIVIEVACVKSPCAVFHFFLVCFIVLRKAV